MLIKTRLAADPAGTTRMDRPEDIETNSVNGKLYCAMTCDTNRGIGSNPDVDGPDPPLGAEATYFGGFDHSQVSALSSPDNITFDREGNLWITTNGQPGTFSMNDGIFAVPVEGEDRGFLRQFLSGVPGGQVASLHFGALDWALFVSIQHPGEPGTGPGSRNSTFENPTSLWPDGQTPLRPSVIVITKSAPGSPVIGT